MLRLTVSRYNFFFNADDGYVLAYNAFSNSFARVSSEEFNIIKNLIDDPNNPSYSTETYERFRNDLKKGSFLTDESLDELEILKMRYKLGRFSQDFLALTICPTLACNFKCSYCFEERKNDTMTPEIETALIKFVERRAKFIKHLHVSWFGGEPTLRIDIIERLVTAFKSICEIDEIKFQPMGIITNDYLLTRDNAKKLRELNIVSAQVTIDGPPEIHDQRRKLNNGHGTFFKVIDNIKESMDILNIHIRVNIDRQNVDEVEKLYDIFRENDRLAKIPFYFGQVQSLSPVCADISTVCFSTKEHSEIVIDLLKKSKEKGFLNFGYPSPHHFGYCIADKPTGYVISPSGYLYKCWNEVCDSVENSIGTIFEDKALPFQLNNMARYMNWDPFQNSKCLECSYIPICVGGCPYISLNNPMNMNCTNFKYNLEEMLRLKYFELKSKKNSNIKKDVNHGVHD